MADTLESLEKKLSNMGKRSDKLEIEISEKRHQLSLLQKEIYIKELEIKIANYENN